MSLSVVVGSVVATPNPMEATCADAKAYFKSNECCSSTMSKTIATSTTICPTLDELITYPKQMGNWTPCPIEEYYTTYDAANPSAPGYAGCVSEDDAKPCGWYDYGSYDLTTKTCTTTGSMTTAVQTVRGGSPTMTADMLRLTGETTLPTIAFPAIPMAYPIVRNNPAVHEAAELDVVFKRFVAYYGSSLDLSQHKMYPSYGTEQGMVATVGIKLLELAQTTCNRAFSVLLEAPAYGYDWGMAVTWAELRASTFYAGTECTCAAAGTCNSKGTVSLTQVGWAPALWASGSKPTATGDDGVSYDPTSTAANSPWIQTNVIPGNPIGRFKACYVPQERCLCDGVYWYPSFVAPGTTLSNFQCYSWAFSITKIYSAQMRAGVYYVMDYAAANTAASSLTSKLHAIGNGLVSYMQVHGQIQLMNKIMEKPFSDPTSWLAAMTSAQYAKWDVMDAAFSVCKAAGVIERAAEQPKYFGAYMFSHMSTPLMGYSENIGAASSDFFKNVIGYDHFNYNWGWRGESVVNYGIGTNITVFDFHRTHLFRANAVYEEEARRMTLVCTDKNAKVTSSFLSVNEWVALKTVALGRRRRLGLKDAKDEKLDGMARARHILDVSPTMKLVDAIKLAEATDPNRKVEWEYGMPSHLDDDELQQI